MLHLNSQYADLVQALEERKLLVVVGPLVREAAGLLGPRGLVDFGLKHNALGDDARSNVRVLADRGEYAAALDVVKTCLGSSRFTSDFGPLLASQRSTLPASLSALADLASHLDHVLTTNLDSLLEDALPGRWQSRNRASANLASSSKIVFKMLGDARHPGTWCFTRDGLRNATYRAPHFRGELGALLRAHRLLLIGYRGDDELLEEMLCLREFAPQDANKPYWVALVPPVGLQKRSSFGESGLHLVPLDVAADDPTAYDLAVAKHLTALARAVSHARPHLDFTPPRLAGAPYPGLVPFEEAQADRFFGRDADIHALINKLGSCPQGHVRWLMLGGQSGIGKSSLLAAGLVPAVRKGETPIAGAPAQWCVAFLRPGREPLRNLAAAVRNALHEGLGLDLAPEALTRDDLARDRALATFLADRLSTRGFLLVIDQFEEAFTVDAADKASLDALLVRSLQDLEVPLYLVTAMRSDCAGEFGRHFSRLAELLNHPNLSARHDLQPLREHDLREAITRPAELVGWHFEPNLVDRILLDAGTILHGEATDTDATHPLAPDATLPLVAHVLRQLVERETGPQLSLRTYEVLGGVSKALTSDADALFKALSAEFDEAPIRRLLVKLVEFHPQGRDTRRLLSRAEALAACGSDKAELLLLRLSGSAPVRETTHVRLIAIRGDGEHAVVDLVHDALVREWSRLRDWLGENREAKLLHRELASATKAWRLSNKSTDDLWRGSRLRRITEALADGTLACDELDKHERDFVSESDKHERAQAALLHRRRLVQWGAGSLAMAVIAAMVGWGLWNRHKAAVAEAQAETQVADADARASQRLVTSSLINAGERHMEGGEFAYAAMYFAQALAREDTPEIRGKLLRAAAEPAPELLWRVESAGFQPSLMSPDGTFLMELDGEQLRRWSTRSGEPLSPRSVKRAPGARDARSIALDPAGARLAVRHATQIEVIDLAGGEPQILKLDEDQGEGGPLAWSDNGERLVVVTCRKLNAFDCERPGLLTVDSSNGVVIRHVGVTLPGRERTIRDLTVNHDGRRVAVVLNDATVLVVDAMEGLPKSPSVDHTGVGMPTVVFDGDQTFLVGRGGEGGIVALDAISGESTPVPLDPSVASRMGSVSALHRLSSGDLVVGGCNVQSARKSGSNCERGYLARVSRDDGRPRWPVLALSAKPLMIDFDEDELLVRSRGVVHTTRIDASTGEKRDELLSGPTIFDSSGRGQVVFPARGATVLWRRQLEGVIAYVRDADSGDLTAFANRSLDDPRWADILADGEMLVVDGSGTLTSFGEFGLGARHEIFSGVPINPRSNERQIFAASAERFAALDEQSRLHLWTRRGVRRSEIPLEDHPNEIAIFDAYSAVIVVCSDGRVVQYDAKSGRLEREWDAAANVRGSVDVGSTPHEGWIAVTSNGGFTLLDILYGSRTDRVVDQLEGGRARSGDARWLFRRLYGQSTGDLLLFEESPGSRRQLTNLRFPVAGMVQLAAYRDELRIFSWGKDISAWSVVTPSIVTREERGQGRRPRQRGEYVVWQFGSPVDTLTVAPANQLEQAVRLKIPRNRNPFHTPDWTVEVAPGGRYVLAAAHRSVILWDTRVSEGRVVAERLRGVGSDRVACDRDGTWCVYNDDERTIGLVRLGGSVGESGRRSTTALIRPILAIHGSHRGRFVVQEGKRRLRLFAAPNDTLGPAIETPAPIRSIYDAQADRFLVVLVTGAVHALTIGADDTIRFEPEPLLESRGEIVGYLPSRALFVSEVDGQTWDILSISKGRCLATIDRFQMGLAIRGDEMWATKSVSSGTHEMRIPLEMLEQSAQAIASDLARRYGLRFDDVLVEPDRSERLALESVPDIYVFD